MCVMLGTKTSFIARLQLVAVVVNLLYVTCVHLLLDAEIGVLRLCLVFFAGLPVATPSEFQNKASFAFGNFENRTQGLWLPSTHEADVFAIVRVASVYVAQWICIHLELPSSDMDNKYVFTLQCGNPMNFARRFRRICACQRRGA